MLPPRRPRGPLAQRVFLLQRVSVNLLLLLLFLLLLLLLLFLLLLVLLLLLLLLLLAQRVSLQTTGGRGQPRDGDQGAGGAAHVSAAGDFYLVKRFDTSTREGHRV